MIAIPALIHHGLDGFGFGAPTVDGATLRRFVVVGMVLVVVGFVVAISEIDLVVVIAARIVVIVRVVIRPL